MTAWQPSACHDGTCASYSRYPMPCIDLKLFCLCISGQHTLNLSLKAAVTLSESVFYVHLAPSAIKQHPMFKMLPFELYFPLWEALSTLFQSFCSQLPLLEFGQGNVLTMQRTELHITICRPNFIAIWDLNLWSHAWLLLSVDACTSAQPVIV